MHALRGSVRLLDIEGSTDNTASRRSPSPAHRLSCQDQRFHSWRRFNLFATRGSDSAVHAGIALESVPSRPL
jgi:hypothetical protein